MVTAHLVPEGLPKGLHVILLLTREFLRGASDLSHVKRHALEALRGALEPSAVAVAAGVPVRALDIELYRDGRTVDGRAATQRDEHPFRAG